MGMQRGKLAPTFYSVPKKYSVTNFETAGLTKYFSVLIIIQPEMFYRIL